MLWQQIHMRSSETKLPKVKLLIPAVEVNWSKIEEKGVLGREESIYKGTMIYETEGIKPHGISRELWVLYMDGKKGVVDEARKKQTGMGFWRTLFLKIKEMKFNLECYRK